MNQFVIAERILLIAVLFLGGCRNNPDIQVLETSRDTVSYDETIRLNNCGGKADSEQTITRSFSTEIESGVEFKVGYQIIEGQVSLQYSEYRNISISQKLIAPPGTNMEFVLRWSENIRAGNVIVNGTKGTYKVHIPTAVEQISSRDIDKCNNGLQIQPTPTVIMSITPTTVLTTPPPESEGDTPLRDHQITPTVGSGVLSQGTYSDGMAQLSESDISSHLDIQRIRLEENPDGCGIAFFSANKIWFGSSVKTTLTINDSSVGTINGPTGKHGYIFNIQINPGDKICVTYFEPSGFQIVFGPDMYYHYDSYCYRGHC